MRLVERARSAGLAVSVEGGRLALEGPEDAEELALELLASEADVLAELAAERALSEAEAPFALLPAGADPERPPAGWTFLRRGRLAGCWLGPDGALDSGSGAAVSPDVTRAALTGPPPARLSFACRGAAWWRLRALSTGRPGFWTCAWCHPPLPAEGAIERGEGGS